MKIILGNPKSKKRLLVLAGVHGNEYTPCIVLNNIMQNESIISLLREQYKSITFIYNVNNDGLKNNTREYTAIDLNRIYQYDFSLIDKIKDLVKESTHIIDLHSSPHCGNFILINQTDTANSYVEYAINNGLNYLIYNQYSTLTIKHQSQLLNKISVTFEMNGIDFVNFNNVKSAQIELEKLITTFHTIKIAKEEPKYKPQTMINAIQDGIYYVNQFNELNCLTLGNVRHTYKILDDNDYIATYPIKGYYTTGEMVLLVQKHNNI